MSQRLRVGIVDFLNSRPLAWGFLRGTVGPDYDPLYCQPSRVADLLAAGEVDVGLIPSIELLRIPDLEIVPGLCVGATREVRSVLLVTKVPLGDVERIAVDRSSRTSQALLEILLEDVWGRLPERVPFEVDARGVPEGFQAALIIGDPALKVDRDRFEVVDLAAAWRRLTGLPFVFAVWAVRSSRMRSGLVDDLEASLRLGLAEIDEIARLAARAQGLAEEEVRRYLGENLRFRLGREEVAGLREFFHRSARRGLTSLPDLSERQWNDLSSASDSRLGGTAGGAATRAVSEAPPEP